MLIDRKKKKYLVHFSGTVFEITYMQLKETRETEVNTWEKSHSTLITNKSNIFFYTLIQMGNKKATVKAV